MNHLTPVRILRGRRRNRVGYIAGDLHNLNRHIARVCVRFDETDDWRVMDLLSLGSVAQGELAV